MVSEPCWHHSQNCLDPAPGAGSAHQHCNFERLLLEHSWQGTRPCFCGVLFLFVYGAVLVPLHTLTAPGAVCVCALCLARAPEAPCEGVWCSRAFTDHFHQKPTAQGATMLFSWELPMSLQIASCPLWKGRSPLRQASVSSGSSNQIEPRAAGDTLENQNSVHL